MKLFCILGLLLPLFSMAQTAVTKSAGIGEEIPSPACLACAGSDWNKPGNISIADDSVTTSGLNGAGNCFMSACFYSRYLYAHHFNFKIPDDATIDSIFVEIKRSAPKSNSIRDSVVQLEKRSVLTGDNLSSTTNWPVTLTYENYGHNDPLWGTSWLPSDINDTTSGVALKIVNITTSETEGRVDHIRMKVYYSSTTGTYVVESSPSVIEWINSPNEIALNVFTPKPEVYSSAIYNTFGQIVNSIRSGRSFIGQNHIECPTDLLSSGIYFWRVMIGQKSFVRKFLITN